MNLTTLSTFSGASVTKADRDAYRVALGDYYLGTAKMHDPNSDVIAVHDPLEIGVVDQGPRTFGQRTWVFDDMYTEAGMERVIKAATDAGRKVHITIADTNYRLGPNTQPVGFRSDLSYDATADQGAPRDRDHFIMIYNTLLGPEGVGIDLAKAGLLTVGGVKLMRYEGVGHSSEIAKGLQWAINLKLPPNTLHIINMSFGGSGGESTYRELFDNAVGDKENIMLVASAGNSGGTGTPSTVGYPAKIDTVIASGAYTKEREIASFSSQGAEVFVAAPGHSIPSRSWSNTPIVWSGTSASGPLQALLLAALFLENGAMNTQDKAKAFLSKYAKDLGAPGRDVAFGFGGTILDDYIDQLVPGETLPPPPTPPAPPVTDPSKPVDGGYEATKTVHGLWQVRWMEESALNAGVKFWRVAIIDSLTLTTTGTSKDSAAKTIDLAVKDYLVDNSSAIVTPDGAGYTEVLEYFLRFLLFRSINQGWPKVIGTKITGADEVGTRLEAQVDLSRFTSSETLPFQLVKIE